MLCDFDGQSAGKILFECWRETEDTDPVKTVTDSGESRSEVQSVGESLSGNSEPCGTARERVAATVACGVGEPGAYTLKIRGGVEVDSNGRKAGKGALVQTELSGTLGVSQDQTLIRPGKTLYGEDVSRTLVSSMQTPVGTTQDALCVLAIDQGAGKSSASVGEEVAPTLATTHGGEPAVYGFEPGAAARLDPENRFNEERAPTLRAKMGDNQASVVYSGAFCPEQSEKTRGIGYEDEKSPTLRAGVTPATVYGICSEKSNAMQSGNPHSGIYEADTSRCLDNNGGNPSCNQGGMVVCYNRFNERMDGAPKESGELSPTLTEAIGSSGNNMPIVIEGNGARPSHQGNGYMESETMFTLNATEHHAVCLGVDAYNQASTGEVAKSLSSAAADSDHVPVVMEKLGVDIYNGKITGDKVAPLTCNANATSTQPILLESNQNHATVQTDGISTSLPAAMGEGGGYVPMIVEEKPAVQSMEVFHCTAEEEKVQPLKARDYKDPQVVVETYQEKTGALMASGYNKLGTQEAANDMFVVQRCWDGGEVAPTLTANNAGGEQRMPDKNNFNAVLSYGLDRASYNQGANAKFDFMVEEEKIGPALAQGPGAVCETYQEHTETMCASIVKGTSNQLATDDMFVANTAVVRRLTPLECTRLQGFPDGWVDIGDWVDSKGKLHKDSDSAKYKALGNSIGLPFWQWLAFRIAGELAESGDSAPTMASLFDGIGGFPLVFSRAGVKPVWASEIEEFPIAVTKKRFPEEEE